LWPRSAFRSRSQNRVLAHSTDCVATNPPRTKKENKASKFARVSNRTGPIGFHIPIYLQGRDFDDTEVVQAARNSLYRMFADLADQSKVWELSPAELERLSKMNLRPVD
jgi:hypothetical protein